MAQINTDEPSLITALEAILTNREDRQERAAEICCKLFFVQIISTALLCTLLIVQIVKTDVAIDNTRAAKQDIIHYLNDAEIALGKAIDETQKRTVLEIRAALEAEKQKNMSVGGREHQGK